MRFSEDVSRAGYTNFETAGVPVGVGGPHPAIVQRGHLFSCCALLAGDHVQLHSRTKAWVRDVTSCKGGAGNTFKACPMCSCVVMHNVSRAVLL